MTLSPAANDETGRITGTKFCRSEYLTYLYMVSRTGIIRIRYNSGADSIHITIKQKKT